MAASFFGNVGDLDLLVLWAVNCEVCRCLSGAGVVVAFELELRLFLTHPFVRGGVFQVEFLSLKIAVPSLFVKGFLNCLNGVLLGVSDLIGKCGVFEE